MCTPFNVACGHYQNCEKGLTGYCLKMNPGTSGAAYGFSGMGPYNDGQAEYLRVAFGDFNCLKLPEDAKEKEKDYVMLSDIFPTGYHATEIAKVQPGDSIVIYSAGPVGLMAALSANIKGAFKVMVVDNQKNRMKLAEEMGAISIDFSKASAIEQVLELTNGAGADKGCECVGYQCCDKQGAEHSNITINELVQAVKATGCIGVVGIFVPKDPKYHHKTCYMKKIIILATGLLLGLAVSARENTIDKKTDQKMDHKMARKDCVMMMDGKMMMAKNGDTTAMQNDIKMSNGTMVTTDGMCKMKDGKTIEMQEGDCMCVDGKMMKKKAPKAMQHKM